MTAFQAGTLATDIFTGGPASGVRTEANVQNLGPNPIYIELGNIATVAGSTRIDPSANIGFRVPAGARVSVIADTANQTTPLDTRVQIS